MSRKRRAKKVPEDFNVKRHRTDTPDAEEANTTKGNNNCGSSVISCVETTASAAEEPWQAFEFSDPGSEVEINTNHRIGDNSRSIQEGQNSNKFSQLLWQCQTSSKGYSASEAAGYSMHAPGAGGVFPDGRVVGVYFDRQRKIWRANWRECGMGKRKTKNFSVEDYGFEEARRLAIQYRLLKTLQASTENTGHLREAEDMARSGMAPPPQERRRKRQVRRYSKTNLSYGGYFAGEYSEEYLVEQPNYGIPYDDENYAAQYYMSQEMGAADQAPYYFYLQQNQHAGAAAPPENSRFAEQWEAACPPNACPAAAPHPGVMLDPITGELVPGYAGAPWNPACVAGFDGYVSQYIQNNPVAPAENANRHTNSEVCRKGSDDDLRGPKPASPRTERTRLPSEALTTLAFPSSPRMTPFDASDGQPVQGTWPGGSLDCYYPSYPYPLPWAAQTVTPI